MGEDVHRLNGGTNGATRGLKERSRTAFSARRSARTPSRAWAAASRWTAGSSRSSSSCTPTSSGWPRTSCSTRSARPGTCSAATATFRSCCGARSAMGTGYGSQHSMDPAGIFATAAGWRIVAPSTPFDYVGLMNSALRLQGPGGRARACRPVHLDRATGRRTTSTTACPSGKAAIRRAGSQRHRDHLPSMVHDVLEAVDAVGRGRRGDRPALARPGQPRLGHHRGEHQEDEQRADRRAGRRSARRTAGGWPTRSSAVSSTGSTSRCSGCTGGEASPSISKVLEAAAIASTGDIVSALRSI